MERIDPQILKAWLQDGAEIAILDAREEREFATSHLLLASCVPLGRLERQLARLVPRRSTRTVWCDAGTGVAERAAVRTAALGYTDVHLLAGGIDRWREHGFALYTGVHVPSKAFAEVVEHRDGTPWISAESLHAKIDASEPLTILDSRSYEEYHANTIPGSMSCPGAELVYRIHDIVPSSRSLVVVNCGGRTRSIIGAQSLIDAGISNPVVSLKDGTMAWHLAGLEVARGATERAPEPSAAAHREARLAAERVARRYGIRRIDAAELERWAAQAEERTLYLVDVRSSEEYAAAHRPGAYSVPGGQLVQETDSHLAVWGARVVLLDDDEVRATMTASWLRRMGWDDTVVLTEDAGAGESGPERKVTLGLDGIAAPGLSPAALSRDLRSQGTIVVDIGASAAYEAGHVPGAWFALRGRLEADEAELPAHDALVITSEDGDLAALAAEALRRRGLPARALAGGTAAWAAAGLELEAGSGRLATPAGESWLTPRNRAPGEREAAMREYLTWEAGLVHQVLHDEDARFRTLAAG